LWRVEDRGISTLPSSSRRPIRNMTLAAKTNAPPQAGWRAPSMSRCRRSAHRPLRTTR